ncbi:MAG: DMT family transporter [Arcobacteraceae bacterium]
MSKISHLQAHLYVLLATFLVAGSFIASQPLAKVINPFSLTLFRFLFSLLILAPFILMQKNLRQKIVATLPRAMVISFFYSIYFMALFESLKTTTVLNTGTLYTLVPLITAVLAFFVFKEKISLNKFLVYLIGLVGTLWVVFKANVALFLNFSLNFGDYIFLIGAFSMCCYSISLKYFYKQDNIFVMVFCTLLGGCIWLGIALLLLNQPLNWHLLQGDLLYNMLYLIIGTTIMTLYLYQKTTVILGPTKVMSYIYLNPIAVAILLYILNDEHVESIVFVGIMISALATLILQKNTRSSN